MTKTRSVAATRPRGGARGGAILGGGRRIAAWCLGALARRPQAALGAVAVFACVTSVVWNTTHQPGRHPAPLFAKPVAAAAEPGRAEAAAPLPVPRPAAAELAAIAPAEPTRQAAADPIGALIRADAGARAAPEPKPAADPARLVAAQKALVKLGYGPLKADGLFGATSRGALERFERDRNLPVTGTVSGRTARQLATLSGYPIE